MGILHATANTASGSRKRISIIIVWLVFVIAFLHSFEGLGFDPSYGWIPTFGVAPQLPAIEDEYVAFCVAVKNQNLDLPEFLAHHYHHHGIRRFYLMDDGSTPPLSTFEYGIPSEAITFRYYASPFHQEDMKSAIYDACISEFGDKHTWMAFIDPDEFLETKEPNTLRGILQELDKSSEVGALAVSWKLHSSAGHIGREEHVRAAYTKCPRDPQQEDIDVFNKNNKFVKSIVKISAYERPLNAHQFVLKGENHTVGENTDVLTNTNGQRWPITRDRIALHYYVTKSKEEFGNATAQGKSWDLFNHIENLEQLDCDEMKDYVP